MQTIRFNRTHVEAIADGRKRATVRRSSARIPHPGDVVSLAVQGSAFATAEVTAVEPYDDLDPAALAPLLAFDSADAMTTAVDKLYPPRRRDRPLLVVFFRVLEPQRAVRQRAKA